MKAILLSIALLFSALASNAQCQFPAAIAFGNDIQTLKDQEKKTVYLNYPGTFQTFTFGGVVACCGVGPFTYAWKVTGCNGTYTATGQYYNWTPTASDACNGNGDNVYVVTLTITDRNGCKGIFSKRLNVVNPYDASGNVYMCDKSTNTISTYTPSQAAANISAGGYLLGDCSVFVP